MSNSRRGGRKQRERHLPKGNPYDGKDQEPQVGAIYEDAVKRVFNVVEVTKKAVRGTVVYAKHGPDPDYACTIDFWAEHWRERRLA